MANPPISRSRQPSLELLQLIRRNGPISRPDLAELTGIAASTISIYVDELLNLRLIEDIGEGESRGGRRPRLLQARPDGGVILAVDLGSKHARLGAFDLSGQLQTAENFPVVLEDGPESVLNAICDQLEVIAAAQGGLPIKGIGIGVPGPVERSTGRIVGPSRMPGWASVAVGDTLAARFAAPVMVDNDANLVTLGEYRTRWPAGALRHVVGVKVGRGIGCGIIANGELYYGGVGTAGDISHVRLHGDSVEAIPCGCGNVGCVETLASGAAVLAQLAERGQTLDSLAQLVEKATAGDPLTNTVLRKAGTTLGEVLAVVVNFFNPEALLIGGALSGADAFVSAVRATVYERCLRLASESLDISVVASGADAGLIGASSMVLDQLGEHPPV